MPLLRVSDLGPVHVVRADGEHLCSGRRQAAILTTLAMNVNRRVSIDELMVGAWGYDAEVSTSTLENQIWRLRRLLDPAYARASASPLVNESGGYRLVLGAGDLDSLTFEALADQAREQLDEGRGAAAVESCDQALALWRGIPYEVVAHLSAAAAATARLEELRAFVLERRTEGLIGTGDLDRAIADLELLTAQFPFRERLWAQQMTALASSGRVEEALQTYARVRTMLREELGLEPGQELRQAQRDLLTANERPLEPSNPRRRAPAVRSSVHLPRGLPPLLGRVAELSELTAHVQHNALVTVTGAGGSGKTRLAVEVARSAAETFPDGTWFVDLTTISSPDQVVDVVTSTLRLSVPGEDSLTTLTDYLQTRRVLLVLDNCEHVLAGAAEVSSVVIESDSGSVVLATSRQPLDVIGEVAWPLAPLSVDDAESGIPPAVALFAARAGVAEPTAADLGVMQQICAAIDGLPLAIELAAALAQVFNLSEILDQVTRDPTRLSRIGRGEGDHRTSVLGAINWSHRLLSPPERAIHRRLSALPGPFTLPAATATVQANDLEVDDIPGGLARLAHRSLLISNPAAREGRPTVFRQLDTVRAHARHQLEHAGEVASTRARRDAWVHQLLSRQPRLGVEECLVFYDNLDDAYPSVRATFQGLISRQPDLSLLGQAARLLFYWYHRGVTVEARSWMQAVSDHGALDGDFDLDSSQLTAFRLTLAGTHLLSGDVGQARHQLDIALPRVHRCPDDALIQIGEALVAVGTSAWGRNEYDIAQLVDSRLRVIATRSGDPDLVMFSDHVTCVAGLTGRPLELTADLAESVHRRAVASGNLLAQWLSGAARMVVSDLAGDPKGGIRWIDRLIPSHVRLGNGGGGAFLESLANFAAQTDDAKLAARMYGAAEAELRRVGMVWPIQLNTAGLLARTRKELSPRIYDDLWQAGQRLTYEEIARERGSISI